MFTIQFNPNAADGAIWSVVSPHNTVIWRTPDQDEAIGERDRLNEAHGYLGSEEVTC